MTEPTTARPSLARWLPLLVVAALGVLLAAGVWMSRNPGRDALPSALIDRPAPEFSLPLLHEPGRMVTGQDLRGAPYLLNVWGSWCPECRVEHPVLTRFAETKRVRVIGYNLKDEHGEALRWLEQFGNPYWMVLVDPDGRAAIDWGSYGAPATLLFAANGGVGGTHGGTINDLRIRDELLPALDTVERIPTEQSL